MANPRNGENSSQVKFSQSIQLVFNGFCKFRGLVGVIRDLSQASNPLSLPVVRLDALWAA